MQRLRGRASATSLRWLPALMVLGLSALTPEQTRVIQMRTTCKTVYVDATCVLPSQLLGNFYGIKMCSAKRHKNLSRQATTTKTVKTAHCRSHLSHKPLFDLSSVSTRLERFCNASRTSPQLKQMHAGCVVKP